MRLLNDERVVSMVGATVYPLLAPADTASPYIVYERNSISPSYDKAAVVVDECNVSVYIYAETYSQSVTLAEYVRAALEGVLAEYEDYEVMECELINASEAKPDDSFEQILTLKIYTTYGRVRQ